MSLFYLQRGRLFLIPLLGTMSSFTTPTCPHLQIRPFDCVISLAVVNVLEAE